MDKLLTALKHPARTTHTLLAGAAKARMDLEVEREKLHQYLRTHFNADPAALHAEYRSSPFRAWYDARAAQLDTTRGVTSGFDCEALYLIVRAAKPRLVVETGVLFGASSAHILEALSRNGLGHLHSIDLPNDPNGPSQDFLIPPGTRERWRLVLGDARDELPRLLALLQHIDLFHHDSLHTFDQMLWEYETAYQYLAPQSVLTSHDVISPPFVRNAFDVFCSKHGLSRGTFRNVGIALCHPA